MDDTSVEHRRKQPEPPTRPNKYALYDPDTLSAIADCPYVKPDDDPIASAPKPITESEVAEAVDKLCVDIEDVDLTRSDDFDDRMAALDAELIPGDLHVLDNTQLVTAISERGYIVYQNDQREIVSFNVLTRKRVKLAGSDQWTYTNGIPLQCTAVIDDTPVYAIVGPDGTYNEWNLETGALQLEHIFWYNEDERVVANALLLRSNGEVIVSHEPDVNGPMTVFHIRSVKGETRQIMTRFRTITSMCETADGLVWAASSFGPLGFNPDADCPIVTPCIHDAIVTGGEPVEVALQRAHTIYRNAAESADEEYDTVWFLDQVRDAFGPRPLDVSPAHFVTTNGNVVVCVTQKEVVYMHPETGCSVVKFPHGFVAAVVSENEFVVMTTAEDLVRIRVCKTAATVSTAIKPVVRNPNDTLSNVEAFPTNGVLTVVGSELYVTVFQNLYTTVKLCS